MKLRTEITYGTFDLLHRGHVRPLERARSLGDRLIVGVTSDQYDRLRGKINVSQGTLERVDAVRATGLADVVLIEEYEGQKIEDVLRYGADVFTVGSDWEGHFDYLRDYCEVVYLDRTEGVSSTLIRSSEGTIRLGVVGSTPYLLKVLSECLKVDGMEPTGLFWEGEGAPPGDLATLPVVTESYGELVSSVDAVLITSHPAKHQAQVMQALREEVHVLCESPVVLDQSQLPALWDEAKGRVYALWSHYGRRTPRHTTTYSSSWKAVL